MEYEEGMERIDSDIMEKVLYEMEHYHYENYTEKDVQIALSERNLYNRRFESTIISSSTTIFRTNGSKGETGD